MRYAVWFVRFLFAAWMIPAGLNHFVPIFPQPMGSQPLSQELIVALLDSHLFDLVKAVELLAGLALLFGVYTPLALIVCLPVSFCVFYWDAPLEGWGSRAALFGYSTLLSNVLLCLAYYRNYLPMFAKNVVTTHRNPRLVLWTHRLFGAVVLGAGAGLLFSPDPLPFAPVNPLAVQLMTSLVNSQLLDVALVIMFVTGIFISAGVMMPAALCLLMPVTTCALYWALILDHQPVNMLLAVAAFAINGLLMLAYLPYYKDVLQRRALAFGESNGNDMNYESLFVNPRGRTAQAAFVPALALVVAAIVFFGYMVGGRTAHFCMLMLLYPAYVLLARRLRDMGQPAWLALIPALVSVAAFGVVLDYFSLGTAADSGLPWGAAAVAAGYALWAGAGRSKTGGDVYAT